MAEKRQQVAMQCKAVSHLADALAAIHEDQEAMIKNASPDDWLVDRIGNRTARIMNTLGDILNGMDAVEDSDAWMDPVFEEAKRQFPQATESPHE